MLDVASIVQHTNSNANNDPKPSGVEQQAAVREYQLRQPDGTVLTVSAATNGTVKNIKDAVQKQPLYLLGCEDELPDATLLATLPDQPIFFLLPATIIVKTAEGCHCTFDATSVPTVADLAVAVAAWLDAGDVDIFIADDTPGENENGKLAAGTAVTGGRMYLAIQSKTKAQAAAAQARAAQGRVHQRERTMQRQKAEKLALQSRPRHWAWDRINERWEENDAHDYDERTLPERTRNGPGNGYEYWQWL
jgi:hypothetical protein